MDDLPGDIENINICLAPASVLAKMNFVNICAPPLKRNCANWTSTASITKRKTPPTMSTAKPFDLSSNSVILSPAQRMETKPTADPDFYPSLSRDYNNFAGHALISEHTFSSEWGMWEMHPKGDEAVYLIEGDVDFVLLFEHDKEEHVVRLNSPGQTVIVPRGVWHTARAHKKSRMIFVTPGEGTRNEAEPVFE